MFALVFAYPMYNVYGLRDLVLDVRTNIRGPAFLKNVSLWKEVVSTVLESRPKMLQDETKHDC